MSESKYMSKFGELSLQEILESLSIYCAMNMANADGIRVILPKKAIEGYSLGFKPIEKIPMFKSDSEKETIIKTHWACSGVIHIHSIEENEEVIKGLV